MPRRAAVPCCHPAARYPASRHHHAAPPAAVRPRAPRGLRGACPGARDAPARASRAGRAPREQATSVAEEEVAGDTRGRASASRRELFLWGLATSFAPAVVGAGAIAEEGSAAPAPSTSAPGKPAQPPATSPTEAKPPTVGAPALEPKEEASLKEGAKRKSVEQLEEEARRILEEEEALAAAAKQAKRRNKLQELQEVRGSLRRKQVEILEKQEELLEKDQTVQVLQMELELERNLRELLIKEKEKAEEQAKLALGLCGQSYLLP
eukprot:jgi/Tetstr1/456245/TSEL_043006.t1